jgi:hypothetical protein
LCPTHIVLCFVFCFFLRHVYSMLPVSLACSVFLIDPSIFPYTYSQIYTCQITIQDAQKVLSIP